MAPRQLGPPAPGSALGLAGAPRRLRLRVRARLRVEHRLPGLPLCVRLRRLLLILARLLLLLLLLLLLILACLLLPPPLLPAPLPARHSRQRWH